MLFDNEIVRKALILIVACVIALIVQHVATKAVRHLLDRSNIPKGSIFVNLIRALIWSLALMAVLEPVFGVHPTAFVAATLPQLIS